MHVKVRIITKLSKNQNKINVDQDYNQKGTKPERKKC